MLFLINLVKNYINYLLITFLKINISSKRFIIKKNYDFKQNAYKKRLINIPKNIDLPNSKLIKKLFTLVKDLKNQNIIDWGGHDGMVAFFIKNNFDINNVYIIEMEEKIRSLNKNENISNYFIKNKIFYYKDINEIKNFKSKITLFSGALSYMENFYEFLDNQVFTEYVCITKAPLVINSKKEFVCLDTKIDTIEKFNSLEIFLSEVKKNFEILYFDENFEKLNFTKKYIENYKIKSYDFVLKRLN